MQGRTSCACVPLVIAGCMRNVVTDGAKTGSIPIRGGGVKISTDDRRGERCGGHVCKIAKWKRGINVLLQNDDIRNGNITSKYIYVTKT